MHMENSVEIRDIYAVERGDEKLHPLAKLICCFRVELNIDGSEYIYGGVIYDRPHSGSPNEYGLIKIEPRDVPVGNIKLAIELKERMGAAVFKKMYNEVIELLYLKEARSFPIWI